jgi:MFS family permease
MDDIPVKGEEESSVTFLKFLKKFDKSEFGRFIFGASIFRYAVYIGAPFIAMYLLNDLHYTYMQFTLIMLTPSVASFLTINLWGKWSDKIGTKRITVIGAYLIGISSIMWLFSKDFYYIFIINVINGMGWAAFNLASSNYVFDASMREEVVSYSAYYNLFLGIAVVLGGITGSLAMESLGITILGSAALFVIITSGVLRLATTTFFLLALTRISFL